MFTRTLFIGVPMGLKNLGDMNDVGVHPAAAADFGADFGDLSPDGVRISGVDVVRGVAGIDISSVSGLSSISVPRCIVCSVEECGLN